MKEKLYYKRCNNKSIKSFVNSNYIMLIILAILSFVLISVLFFNNANAETTTEYEKVYISIEINEGDTMSLYAEKYAISPKYYDDYIEEIRYINNLKNDNLLSGCYLLIPVYVER